MRDRGGEAVTWSELASRLTPAQISTDLVRSVQAIARGMSGQAEATLASLGDLPDPTVASAAELDALLGRGRLRTWTDDLHGGKQDLPQVTTGWDACRSRSVNDGGASHGLVG
jgi:hypothetical protein